MKAVNPFKRGFHIFVLVMVAGSVFLSGCVSQYHESAIAKWTPPSSDCVWMPPPDTPVEPSAPQKTADIPQGLLAPEKKWQLTDIIDIALRNNPQTRATWHAARSAAADWMSKKGDYYPQVSGAAIGSHINYLTSKTGRDDAVDGFIPELELTWLLFDFGGRKASVAEKQQALLAADFTHNAAIQDAVFLVLQTYFQYTNAKVLLKASEASFNEAATNLEMAQQRHENGLATIADVLLAKTAVSQAQLNLDVIQGQVQTIRGTLATAMGIPANTPYDTQDLPLDPPVGKMMEAVETYIQQAQANRPDLAAQRSRVEQAMATVRVKQSAQYPSLLLDNTLAGSHTSVTNEWDGNNTVALVLSIPLFKGYARQYDVLKAQQDVESQKARLDTLAQSIILQVWTSYFDLKTSIQRVKTTNDLLKSATQSYEVASGRYKEGVGGILDLLSAQSSLENARAQRVVAQAAWYIAFSKLARDTGALWQPSDEQQDRVLDLIPGPTEKELE